MRSIDTQVRTSPPSKSKPEALRQTGVSGFTHSIPSALFPAEKDRYVLYVSPACPWAHRASIAHALKGLENVVQLVQVDGRDPKDGWCFSSGRGDAITGCGWLREVYLLADPEFDGRITVPVLWDRVWNTIVNNDSAEILRMLLSAFDALLPAHLREENKGLAALIPRHLALEIDAFNGWVFSGVNNAVYRVRFAADQESYNARIDELFLALDRVETHLGEAGHTPFLFGLHVSESDIRLFTTIVRFDVAYFPFFQCNARTVRRGYPRLHRWLQTLYWNQGPETTGGAFKKTTDFEAIKRAYYEVRMGGSEVPEVPVPDIMPLDAEGGEG